MKVRYLREHISQWIRIPLSDVTVGEKFKELILRNERESVDWWTEHWYWTGKRLEPIHELNSTRWGGYDYPNPYFNGATVLVER